MNPVLTQRVVTFCSYFFGFLILDRLTFFGDPPSIIESFVMALVLGLVVTLVSPLVATWLDRRTGSRTSGGTSGRR
ncbi:MAG: hypothetical protein ABL953_02565 [Ilumatobacteraceae bacterium]